MDAMEVTGEGGSLLLATTDVIKFERIVNSPGLQAGE